MHKLNVFSSFIVEIILLGIVVAFRDYQDHIPNGDRVPDPCHPNKLWQGVGHKQLSGGGDRNPFGKDFKEAGKKWTVELCRKDSDGDGKTNGEELGDPNCVWVKGTVPELLDGLSHPGICDPYDSEACKTMNNWKICQEQEFICPLKEEEGVIKETYRMTRNRVPAKDTTYQCQYMELPKDRDYHLIASEPYIDNANVMHHIVVRGCPDEVAEDMKKEFSDPKECGMVASKCNVPLTGWTLGILGYCVDAPAAFRFGKTRFNGFLLEFHWTNVALREDYWDSSGMTFYYTPNLRPYDAGTLFTGQSHLVLPPKEKEVTREGFCPSRCTRKMLKEPIKIIRGLHHMHLLGEAALVEHHHDGQKDVIIDEPYFSYDNPKTFEYKPEVVLKPGDALMTRCVYNTMSRQENTYWGDDTFNEMCYGIFTYYPAEKGKTIACVSVGEADCLTYNESECDFKNVNEYRQEFIKGLYDFCDPTGQTCNKCCLLYLTSTLKGDPCWRGIMRETTQFLITNRWDDRNVTRMLLKCEQEHDLDVLLMETETTDVISGTQQSMANWCNGNFIFILWNLIVAFILPTLRRGS